MSKTLIVTGTSRGIGNSIVHLAVKQGYKVYALSRKIKSLPKTGLMHPLKVNLSDEKDLDSFAALLKSENVKVDALINNAGAFLNRPFLETSKEDFEKIYKVNVFGLASITRKILPFIASNGHVLNISSMGGLDRSSKFPGLSAYSSSKGAVNILTELLSEEFKDKGPAFNALALGAVQTEMLEEAFPGLKAPLNAKEMASYILNFAISVHKYFNGKILPVSLSTP